MSLDDLRKRVAFHNSVDVWIAACGERDADWTNPENYKKFIAYLLKNNLSLKAFNLCAHEAGATDEAKTQFADTLAQTKDDSQLPELHDTAEQLCDGTYPQIQLVIFSTLDLLSCPARFQ